MSVSLFDSLLTTSEMIKLFDDETIVQAMLRFEEALAEAKAAEGIIPKATAQIISSVCKAQLYDIPALIVAGRSAGSLAIPLIKELTRTVALRNQDAAAHIHWGSTSQDVLDTALVLVSREALKLIDIELVALTQHLITLAQCHLDTPVLARTLMQPAQVTSFGFKVVGWAAPLVRSRAQLYNLSQRAMQLQLGGAVGTLTALGKQGPAIAKCMANTLGLKVADAAWHTQRDEWVRLGVEMAVLTGSLGKIATDLSLMAQGEVAELAEPTNDRGGSSAMPHKRNPVSCMIALSAATRAPHQAATLLAAMAQQHERGLGNWQAELAEWPALFLGAHGALRALNEAFAELTVNEARMLRNIDALQGLVFAESAAILLGAAIGRPEAQALLEKLTRQAVAEGRHLANILVSTVLADDDLRQQIDIASLHELFDPVVAVGPACALAKHQLDRLRSTIITLNSATPTQGQS